MKTYSFFPVFRGFVFAGLIALSLSGCVSYDQPTYNRSAFFLGDMGGQGGSFPKYDRANLLRVLERKRRFIRASERAVIQKEGDSATTTSATTHENQANRWESGKIDALLMDVINEAAVRRDPAMGRLIAKHESELKGTPELAIANYRYALGDKAQLKHLLIGKPEDYFGEEDSIVLLELGYVDEWNESIRWLKLIDDYNTANDLVCPGEHVSMVISIRRMIYGEKKFQEAWDRVKTK